MRAFAGRVGFTCMALGALAAGCNNTETAVFLTIRAGQSIAQPRLAEVRRIDIAVSGAETYLFSVAVAANQFADGVVTVRYRPGASSGTLLLSAVARSGGDENIGQGRTSAVLMAQQEVTAELVLEAAGMMLVDGGMDAQPPDLSPADVPRFDLSTLDGPPPDLALPDLVMQDMTRPPDFTMDLSMTDIALVMPDLRMPDMAVVMPDLVMPDMAMPDLVMVMPDLVMVMPDLTVRDMAMMMAMPDLVPPPDLVIPDFALPPDLVVRDLAPPPDLMLPPDLTPLPDLAPLPDLVPPKDFVVAKAVTLSSFTSNALLHTPAVIAAADFDQDNKRDVVVTTPGGTSMSVFYGNGDGTLTMNFDTASGTSPTGVVASDFNSDAGPDVITSDFSTNQVVCNQNSKGMRNNQFNQQVEVPHRPHARPGGRGRLQRRHRARPGRPQQRRQHGDRPAQRQQQGEVRLRRGHGGDHGHGAASRRHRRLQRRRQGRLRHLQRGGEQPHRVPRQRQRHVRRRLRRRRRRRPAGHRHRRPQRRRQARPGDGQRGQQQRERLAGRRHGHVRHVRHPSRPAPAPSR